MPRSRPTDRALSELRAAAHRDVDAIFDAWPAIVDLSYSGDSARKIQQTDADMIRAKGSLTDPTIRHALTVTAANTWRRTLVKLTAALQKLAAQAADMVEPLPANYCPECEQEIKPDQTTVTSGRRMHRACYDRSRRATGLQDGEFV